MESHFARYSHQFCKSILTTMLNTTCKQWKIFLLSWAWTCLLVHTLVHCNYEFTFFCECEVDWFSRELLANVHKLVIFVVYRAYRSKESIFLFWEQHCGPVKRVGKKKKFSWKNFWAWSKMMYVWSAIFTVSESTSLDLQFVFASHEEIIQICASFSGGRKHVL